jgi:hypothetical protein
MGKEDGDEVTVERPRGSVSFTITGISYKPPKNKT